MKTYALVSFWRRRATSRSSASRLSAT